MEDRDIELYFQELGDELEQRGFRRPVRMMIVGGAYMLLTMHTRQSTQDVDVMLLDYPDTHIKTKETKAFLSAVYAVASRHKMKRKWLNDVVADFIRDMAPHPQLSLWQTYGKLQVYVPTQEYILALKLMVYREKDKNDVAALLQACRVTSREQAQAIVDRVVPDKQYQELYILNNTFDELF